MQTLVLMSVICSATVMELSIINSIDAKLHRIPKGDVAKAPSDPTNGWTHTTPMQKVYQKSTFQEVLSTKYFFKAGI